MSDRASAGGSVAELVIEIRYLRRDFEKLSEKLEKTEKKVSEMQVLINRYRGGIAVILGAGALIGWIISNVAAGAKIWH